MKLKNKKPNIIFIMADDLGYGDLSCYGAEKIKTPNMDKVAASGIKFTDAHSSSAVCTPSRYSVITGSYCWRSRLKSSVLWGFSPALITPELDTVPKLLKRTGYATAAIGKWHLGMGWKKSDGTPYEDVLANTEYNFDNIPRYDGFDVDYSQQIDDGPIDAGFDYFWGIAGSLDMPPYCFIENTHTVGIPNQEKFPYSPQQKRGLMTVGWKDDQVDIVFAEKACKYIESRAPYSHEEPFFLYLTPSAPHRPCVPSDFMKNSSGAGDRGDCVQLLDWLVGRVLETLEEQGIASDTLLMITSDNGAVSSCLNGCDYGHSANGIWRGQKADIWEGGHREPFIARWPGVIGAGGVCNDLICLSDLITTCAELTSTKIDKDTAKDSVSFLNLLIGKQRDKSNRLSVIHHSLYGMFSFRKENWKLILGLGSGGFTQPPYEYQLPDSPEGQLYDLSKDPQEQHNLYFEYPEVVTELKNELLLSFEQNSE